MKTQRTRVTNGMIKMPNMTGFQTTMPAGNISYTENVDFNTFGGTYRDITDFVTPGYKRLVKRGTIVANPAVIRYSRLSHDRTALDGTQTFTSGSVWYKWHTNDLSLVRHLGPLTTANSGFTDLRPLYGSTSLKSIDLLYNKAAISAWSKVRPPEMQTLVTLAELDKSVKLIADTARKLANVIDAIKQGKPDRVISRLMGRPDARRQPSPIRYTKWNDDATPNISHYKDKNGSNKPKVFYGHSPRKTKESSIQVSDIQKTWLEYRYGWGPMVMDIVNALAALNKARNPQRFMVRGFASDEVTESQSGSSVKAYGTTSYRVDVSHSRKIRAYVLYEVNGTLGATIRDFGLLDFPASAWELLPYSFVVDWFIPVGDWLSAITPKIGVDLVTHGASITEHISVARTATGWIKTAPTNSWDMSAIVGKTDSGETRHYERKELLEIPAFPSIDVKLNVKRAIDAIALMGSAAGRNIR